jgi:molybdenum cofactor cytidylyltransferase
MTQRKDITGLVLAAGFSSRMKRFKPLLPLGRTTALERCVNLFLQAGIDDVRVVVGYGADEVIPVLDARGVRWIMNDRFEQGMFSSVRAGVATLESSKKGFFLLPVDIPLVRPTTVLDLLAARDTRSGDVWYPRFLGRRGHPPLIATHYRQALLTWDGQGGLRSFLSEQRPQSIDVEVADEHILMDMDSPEHYEAALSELVDYDIPSVHECMVLLTEKFRVDKRILAHSSKVAQVALHLTRALNETGCGLNVKLIVAAALLHDLAKGRADHAAVAASALTEIGYPTVAEIVRSHMDTQPLFNQPISSPEVVCFADKLVQADRIVPIEERFRTSLGSFGEHSALAQTVHQRLSHILSIRERLEAALGSSVERALPSGLWDNREVQHEDLSLQARSDRVPR